MKKISMAMLFLAAFSMAEECDLKLDGNKVTVLDTTLWWKDSRLFWGADFILEDGYNCRKGEYEKSFVDSNTYIQRKRVSGGLQSLIIGQNSLSDYEIGDVFREEFLRWQKCGMLNLTYEQADSIATSLAKAMDLRDSSYYKTDLFF